MSKRVRSRRWKKAVSVPISSIIIGSTILTAIFGAVLLSTQLIESQAERVEFEQAKSAFLLFATSFEDVSLKPQSASHTVIHTRAGGLNLVRDIGDIEIKIINGSAETVIYSQSVNHLRFLGGRLVTVPGLTYLKGTGSPIVQGFSEPLGHVYVNQSGGAWTVLDYSRARVVRHGSFYLYTQQGVNEKVNLLEVTFVMLLPGDTFGSGTIRMRAENINVTTTAFRFNGNEVTIEVSSLGVTESIVLTGEADDVATVVNLVVAFVRVSTL